MKAEFRIPLRALLLVTFTGSFAVSACGNPVETIPPDENGGTGGTAPIAGNGGTSGTMATGGTSGTATGGASGSTASGGSAGSTGGAGGSPTGGASGSGGSGAGTGGAAGSAGSGGVTPVAWSEMSLTVNGSCAKTMCHNGFQEPSLIGFPASAQAAQYTVLTTHVVPFCGSPSMKLVAPGDVANSAILKLVKGECSLDGEPFMMPGDCTQAPCLPAMQIATITNWILSGAPGPL